MDQPDHTWLAILAGMYSLVLLVGVPAWALITGRADQ